MQTKNTGINNRKYKNQAGLSLLELSLGLAITLVVAGIAIGFYTTTSATQRAADAQTQVLQLSTAIRSASTGGAFDGVNSEVIAVSKRVPDSWIVGNELRNPFGGTYDILPGRIESGTFTPATGAELVCTNSCNGFQITMNDIPTSACNTIVTASAPNFAVIRVGATVVKNSAAATPVDLNAAELANACATEPADLIFQSVG